MLPGLPSSSACQCSRSSSETGLSDAISGFGGDDEYCLSSCSRRRDAELDDLDGPDIAARGEWGAKGAVRMRRVRGKGDVGRLVVMSWFG